MYLCLKLDFLIEEAPYQTMYYTDVPLILFEP